MRAFTFALTLSTIVAVLWWLAPLLHPVDEPGLDSARNLFPRLNVVAQRTKVWGYSREEFGDGWEKQGNCTTRELVLLNHFGGTGCRASASSAVDLYTGKAIKADTVEIDHIFPLSAAWDLGAFRWDKEKRVRFANDPINLIGVAGPVNRAKSDSLPSAWLPPDRRARCWYVRRLSLVALQYDLPLPRDDVRVTYRQCLSTALTLR